MTESSPKPTKETKPVPTLLSVSDAMLFAADEMERRAHGLELIALISGMFSKPDVKPLEGEAKEAMDNLRISASGIIDKDLQLSAMRGAAKEIRAHANEAKLAEARAARSGIAIPVTA